MEFHLSPSEQLVYSTARIECTVPDGVSTGTGFFYRFLDDGKTHLPAIVTNKHVIEGSSRGQFHLTKKGEHGGPLTGEHLAIRFDKFESRWIMHPDPDVDLCVMLLGPLLNKTANEGLTFFYFSLDDKLIWSEERLADLTALEDVIMIGYPSGIWDSVNNFPIIRRGITATHPAFDYNGKPEFMIDAACFPGSSGSPVFLFNVGTYAKKTGEAMAGTRIALLGVLYAGPQFTATGEIEIVDVPTRQRPISKSKIPLNLGLVIKSKLLFDFDPVLKEIRDGRAA